MTRYHGLGEKFKEFIKNQQKADEKKRMDNPFSHFVGFYCISWWSDTNLQKVFIQDEVKAVALYDSLSEHKKSNCSGVMLTQDNLLIKRA